MRTNPLRPALAFLTFKIFHVMIPGEPPHARSALRHIQETAVEIVCRRLLGERSPSGPPLLHSRETVPPVDMMPDRKLLMDTVQYWSASCPFPTSIDLIGDDIVRLGLGVSNAMWREQAVRTHHPSHTAAGSRERRRAARSPPYGFDP